MIRGGRAAWRIQPGDLIQVPRFGIRAAEVTARQSGPDDGAQILWWQEIAPPGARAAAGVLAVCRKETVWLADAPAPRPPALPDGVRGGRHAGPRARWTPAAGVAGLARQGRHR